MLFFEYIFLFTFICFKLLSALVSYALFLLKLAEYFLDTNPKLADKLFERWEKLYNLFLFCLKLLWKLWLVYIIYVILYLYVEYLLNN